MLYTKIIDKNISLKVGDTILFSDKNISDIQGEENVSLYSGTIIGFKDTSGWDVFFPEEFPQWIITVSTKDNPSISINENRNIVIPFSLLDLEHKNEWKLQRYDNHIKTYTGKSGNILIENIAKSIIDGIS